MKRALSLLITLLVCAGCSLNQDKRPIVNAAASNPHLQTGEVTKLSTTEYEIRKTLTVINGGPGQPAKHNLWLALIRDALPYQEVLSTTIKPGKYQIVTDEYGNRYAEFDLGDMPRGSEVEINVTYQLAVNELAYDLGDCQGELPDFDMQSELHIESHNPQIIELAEQITRGKKTACEKVLAFYDYIGNNLVYSYNGANWGAQAALGDMGADCTEFSSLLIALSRASGIPARYVEGLHYFDTQSEALARTEHAWLEVYLPEIGWTPLDPTLGRSSLNRQQFFARHTPGHIILTYGRNPSTLRGSSYWTHLYWPGSSTNIHVQDADWDISVLTN
jgi:transglutaminase-like putative cysteine protease